MILFGGGGKAGEPALPCNPKRATCGGLTTCGGAGRRPERLPGAVDEDAPERGVVGGRASVGGLRTPARAEPCQAREGAALRRGGAASPQACPRNVSGLASGVGPSHPGGPPSPLHNTQIRISLFRVCG